MSGRYTSKMTKKVHEQGSAVCSVKAKCQKAGEPGDSIVKSAALLEQGSAIAVGGNKSKQFPAGANRNGKIDNRQVFLMT